MPKLFIFETYLYVSKTKAGQLLLALWNQSYLGEGTSFFFKNMSFEQSNLRKKRTQLTVFCWFFLLSSTKYSAGRYLFVKKLLELQIENFERSFQRWLALQKHKLFCGNTFVRIKMCGITVCSPSKTMTSGTPFTQTINAPPPQKNIYLTHWQVLKTSMMGKNEREMKKKGTKRDEKEQRWKRNEMGFKKVEKERLQEWMGT